MVVKILGLLSVRQNNPKITKITEKLHASG